MFPTRPMVLTLSLLAVPAAYGLPLDPLKERHETPIETPMGLVMLEASIDGDGPRWFAFDTGASNTFIDADWADALDLEIKNAQEVPQPGGTVRIGQISGATLGIGDFDWEIPLALTAPLERNAGIVGRRLSGIIGYDFLREFAVEIDYAGNTLRFEDVGTYEYDGDGDVIPLQIIRTKPMFDMPIGRLDGEEVTARICVDVGSTRALGLASHFYPRALSEGQAQLESRGAGFGGTAMRGALFRVPSIRLGSRLFEGVVTYGMIADGTSGRSFDGIIGGELLRRYTAIFDYADRVMILEPNERIDEPMREPTSGLLILSDPADPGAVLVHQVYARSAAEEAGLLAGDVVIAVDGRPARDLGFDAIWDLLRSEPGRVLQLRVQRDDEELDVELRLRRLDI